ncbi:MAG TPA: hypothetical protein PLP56_00895 [Candidatus Omnitrophota bacterium]|nr:hypothetical protein [Candidatus Omnitrophota bacterium]HNQ51196.1 hypothetical protein [Candidatus Omnitrophota bacterium]HQO37600.1 hypothetical protein [Candidatus Omnitrophota bacterium]HQQ05522.1 hypothetical protein [Candidatus Omnitrophota bacterium]
MHKITASFFIWFCVCAPAACAQIGGSVEGFKTGKFALAEGFNLHGSYLITDDPVHQGRYAYNFFTADNRYRIQLIADKKGRNIVFEYFFYPADDDPMAAMKDGSIAIAFVSQASGTEVGPEEFVSLVSEANRGRPNIKFTKIIKRYTVSMTRHDTDILKGWSIGIRR